MAEVLQKPRCSKSALEDINTRSRLLESLIRTLWDRVLQKKISESPAKAKDYSIPYIDPDNCQECDEEANSKSVKNAFNLSEDTILRTILSERTLNSYNASINPLNFLIANKDVCQTNWDTSYNHASDSLESLPISLNSTPTFFTENKSAIRTLPTVDVMELQYNYSTTLNMDSGVIPMEKISADHAQLRLPSVTPTQKISESSQNPINAFVCKICDKRLLTKKSLNQHKNTVHKDPKLWRQCPFCEYKTPRKSSFDFHIAVCKASNQPRVYSFVCEVCSKTFVLKRHLNFHKKKHGGNQSQIKIASSHQEFKNGDRQ